MTSLYRRYRSARLTDLIGQGHIARTLSNELRHQSLSHAYLFAGIRGTGKTSTARILARAVNCLAPVDAEPCNTCAACVEILSGAAVDVLEIDAASNRGIDEMRDLRDKVKYLPASLTRKVYIIDEAHMLTSEAWNAFLKTLEEPPGHVLFILCTTEPHKVPETVRSRVQRFDFRRVAATELGAHLRAIAATEEVEVEPMAIDLIGRAAQGSVRDALSLLDQVIATGIRPVSADICRQALGLADPETIRDLLTGLGGRDAAACLRAAAVAFDAGVDARQLLRECARLARATELCAVGFPEGAGLAGDEEDFCQRLAAVAPGGFWLQVLEQTSAGELELRQPVDARLQVEACLLRLCRGGSAAAAAVDRQLAGVEERLTALERRLASSPAELAGPPAGDGKRVEAPAVAAEPRPGGSVATAPEVPLVSPAPGVESTAAARTPSVPSTPVAATTPGHHGENVTPITGAEPLTSVEGWQRAWPLLQEAVNRRDRVFAGVLRSCRPLQADADGLVIGAPYKFHLGRIRDPGKATILAEAVAAVAGGPRVVTSEFCGETASSVDASEPGPDLTQAVLAAFSGSRVTSTRLRDHHRDPGPEPAGEAPPA